MLPHAYFKYDLDDPHPKQAVHVFKRQQLIMHVTYEIPPVADPIAEGTAAAAEATSEANSADGGSDIPSGQPTGSADSGKSHDRNKHHQHHSPFNSFVASGGTIGPLFSGTLENTKH